MIMSTDHYTRNRAVNARINSPDTADNMTVRLALLARVRAGEITLAQCQAELAEIQRKARAENKPTAYRP